MIRHYPESQLTDTPFPSATSFRSLSGAASPRRRRGRERVLTGKRPNSSDPGPYGEPGTSAGRRRGVWRRPARRKRSGRDTRARVPTPGAACGNARFRPSAHRSEEHTSELQSLMRISYAVFCLKKKTQITNTQQQIQTDINKKYKE